MKLTCQFMEACRVFFFFLTIYLFCVSLYSAAYLVEILITYNMNELEINCQGKNIIIIIIFKKEKRLKRSLGIF